MLICLAKDLVPESFSPFGTAGDTIPLVAKDLPAFNNGAVCMLNGSEGILSNAEFAPLVQCGGIRIIKRRPKTVEEEESHDRISLLAAVRLTGRT
jgi:hypothetical protein